MSLVDRLRARIDATHFIDTHEHLFDEEVRLAGTHPHIGDNGWTTLFTGYLHNDLCSAGLSGAAADRLFAGKEDPVAAFARIAPYWEATRHTGYAQAVRLSIAALYGEHDLTAHSAPRIAAAYRQSLKPGLYADVFARARIRHAHVNSMEDPVFKVTASPAMLGQDINITGLVTPVGNTEMAPYTAGIVTLDDWIMRIDGIFDTYGPHAAAVKCQIAYQRRLDFAPVDRRRAAAVFTRAMHYGWAPAEDIRDIEDFLVRHCLEAAIRQDLPVKFHTGHHFGCGSMPIGNVARNAGDLTPLIRDFPDVRFVIFHIGYPYQHEYISLAKHYPNVYLDMCWAWILDPVAAVGFLKQFLVAVPSNKVTTFGGDYYMVEPVLGHAMIARAGLAQALAGLIDEGWIGEADADPLIDALMHGNADALYGPPKPGVRR